MFKCIWNFFLHISLVFISQNNSEPVEISENRLNDNYVATAHVISDQVVEAGVAGVQGSKAVRSSLCLSGSQPWRGTKEPMATFASASGVCGRLCFSRAGEPPSLGSVGESCYIRPILSEQVG